MTATKGAVQLSFILSQQFSNEEDVVSSSASVVDLDEGFASHNDPHQHDRFVKFLKGYLEYYRNKEYYHRLDTLRLNMKMDTKEEVSILRRWLELAFEEGVKLKELEISCSPSDEPPLIKKSDEPPACCLSWLTTFANAKFLTKLKLDCVRFESFSNRYIGTQGPGPIFPSLKVLSLKGLRLCNNDLLLWHSDWTCPSLEYLSLTDFCFEKDKRFDLWTCSLKSLEFNVCEMPRYSINAYKRQADITESFTWIGVRSNQMPQSLKWMTVVRTARMSLTYLNLQCVKIVKIQKGNDWASKIDAGPLFPSLKTMSFTNIQESKDDDLLSILSGCPTLEYLSLTECCGFKCHVSSSSLKSLKIKHCSRLRLVQIDDAENLESIEFLSLPQPSHPESSCKKVILDNSFNLKNINICVVDDLVEFSLNGCQYVRSHLDLMNSFHKIAPSALINIDCTDSKGR